MQLRSRLALVCAIGTCVGVAAPAAATVTINTVTYTLTDDQMGGTFGSAVASGSYGYRYYSDGRTYRFSTLTVSEAVYGYNFTYDFSQNCLSISPNCGPPAVPSQFPGASGFNVGLTIDSYALNGPSSRVPTSFSDFVFDETGYGTLSYSQSVSTVPDAPLWSSLIIGFGLVGAGLRRRSAAAAIAGHALVG